MTAGIYAVEPVGQHGYGVEPITQASTMRMNVYTIR